MPVQSFSEYRPDVSDYEGSSSKNISNVVPRGDGYGPFAALFAFSAALPAACRGYFYARKNDGSISAFAGTSTKLYQLNNTNQTWTDVSLGAGTYTALASGANWQFAQFNNYVFATQVNAKLQIFDLTSSTAFADRADSNCPQAAYVAVVNRFLLLTGIASPNVYRMQWSGLNDVSSSSAFTSGINSSDFQDLPDGGIVRGIAGGEMGVVFQDATIRTVTYAPGSSYIFYIQRLSQDDGMYAPYSLVRSGDRMFWVSPQGFKTLLPGGYPTPIGKERVDRTFFADVDTGNLQLVIGANDPTQTRVYFAYKSLAGAAGQFDKVLTYDWALDKWTPLVQSGQYLASLSKPGITLEGVDAAYGQGVAVNATSMTTAGLWTAAQTLTAGQGVQVTSSGNIPSGFTAATPYYVMATNLTTSAFQLSASGAVGGLAGAVVTSTSTGSGTLSYAVESIEALNISSLDAISNAALSQLSGIDGGGKLGFFTGANLQATLETPEHGGDGRRIFVRGARIVTDAASAQLSVSHRESPQATQTYSTATSMDTRGFAPQRVSTRYARNRVTIPAASVWTFAAGVEPDVVPEGLR